MKKILDFKCSLNNFIQFLSVFVIAGALHYHKLDQGVFLPTSVKIEHRYIQCDESSKEMLYAQADGPILTNPDWVPPVNRGKYPGYQIMEDAKKNSQSWKYSTNRPGGKIRGSGTVKYLDYRSVTSQTKPDSALGGKSKKK